MSNCERTGHRDLTYSRWHRPDRLSRYVGARAADACGMIDIDGLEYCRPCGEPLALVETARQSWPKDANATVRLGAKAGLTVYSLAFKVDTTVEMRCSECGHITDHGDITEFRVRQLHPPPIFKEARRLTPYEWAVYLVEMREHHWATCSRNPAPLDWDEIRSRDPEAA